MAPILSAPNLSSWKPTDGCEPPASRFASPDAVDLTEIWALIRRRRAFILAIGAMVFAIVIGFTLVSSMSFRANSRLYLGELSDQTRNAASTDDELDRLGGTGGDVGSEIEIIKSRSLVTRAVLDAGLNVQVAHLGSSPLRYWQWLLSRRNPMLLKGTEQEVVATDTRLVSDAFGPQTYRVIFRDGNRYELWKAKRDLGQGELGQELTTAEVNLRLQAGSGGSPRSGAEYELSIHPVTDIVESVLDTLEVTAAKTPIGAEPVKVINLGFSARSPRLAAAFLNALMGNYLAERQAWKTEDATAAGAFVTGQLTNMRETLDQIEKKLAEYRSKNRVVVLDSEAKAMIEQVGKYEEQRVAARLEVAALADVKRALKTPTVPVEAFMVGEAKDSVLENMAASLAKSRQELTDLETRFNTPAPNVREQRQQVEAQQAAIKSYVTGRLQRAQENLGTLDHIIKQFEERLRTVPGAELGLTQLSRESDVYSNLYSYLLKRQQQTAIIKASTVSKNRVLDVPQAPFREDSPRLFLRLASAPLGLLLGAMSVVLWALLAGTFQSESDVRRYLGAAPIFGRLPTRRKAHLARRRASEALTSFDFPKEGTDGEWVEAFRTLRTNLWHASQGSEQPVVMVTSPTVGDGKTACVLSLAEMLAAGGRGALVIETDLRRPKPSALYDDGPDLKNVLEGSADWRDAVRSVPAPLGEFHVLIAKRAASAELLSGAMMRDLLRDVRSHYDIVLLDVASFPRNADALVLAPYTDMILSVVRLRKTPKRTTLQHFRDLTLGVPHVVVLNDVESQRGSQSWAPLPEPDTSLPDTAPRTSAVTIPAECLVSTPHTGASSSN